MTSSFWTNHLLAYARPIKSVGKSARYLSRLGGFIRRLGQVLNRETVAERCINARRNIRPLCQILLIIRELCKVRRRLGCFIAEREGIFYTDAVAVGSGGGAVVICVVEVVSILERYLVVAIIRHVEFV